MRGSNPLSPTSYYLPYFDSPSSAGGAIDRAEPTAHEK
jgi:hypothetical protein